MNLIFRGICAGNKYIQESLDPIIKKLCKGYSDLYKQQSKSETLKNAQKDEFFGLRDFYRLKFRVFFYKIRNNISKLKIVTHLVLPERQTCLLYNF